MVEYKYFIKPLTGLHQVWQDVTHAVVKGKELKLRKGFSSLSSAVDMGSVSVELHMASLEDAVLLHVGRRQVLITANGSPIFEGVSYDDSKVSLKERSDYVFATLKFKPYSAFFETAIAPADIALVDKKICDPTDKANSLLHILFDLIVENVDPEVQPILEDVFQLETAIVNTKVLRLFLIEEGENLEDYLTEFLYHSGYAYYMDLHTVKVITPYGGYPSTSVSIKDIIASPRISQAPYIDEHKVVVRLGKIITADDEVVYELNPARDEETGEPTETAYLPPASFYPLDIDDEPSILEADYGNEKESDDVELAYAENVSLSYDARQIDPSDPSKTIPASLLVTEETLKPTSAELQFKNALFVDVSLRNVVVTAGRAYYRDWSEEHEDASSKAREIETIDGLYLPDSFSAKAFIDRYVAEEEAERTKITFKTHLVFEPGAVLEFSDIPYPLLVRYVTQLDETYFEYECVAHLIPSSTIKTRVRVAPKRIPRDGVIGPEGVQGPQGERGPQGEQGPPGSPGAEGRGVVSVVTEYTLGDSSTELEEVELSPDLVAYLPFNGTAKDYVSGQIASATDVSVVNGPGVKKAYLFNGSTSRITVPDIGSSPKGFSVMVYVDAIPTGNEIVLVHGTSKIGLGFYSNGSLITGVCGGTNPKVAIISNFNAGQWNNIVVNYVTGGAEVFINGVETSYSSATNCWTAGGNDLTIGFRDTSSPGPFKGALADLRVYSRNITPADYDDILEDLQRVTTVWDTTPPDRQAGQFLWTRQVITYTDDTVTITEPVCVTGDKGSSGNPGALGVSVDGDTLEVAGYDNEGIFGASTGRVYLGSSFYTLERTLYEVEEDGYGYILGNASGEVTFARLITATDSGGRRALWSEFNTGEEIVGDVVVGEFLVENGEIVKAEIVPIMETDRFIRSNLMAILRNSSTGDEQELRDMAEALGADKIFQTIVAMEAFIRELWVYKMESEGFTQDSEGFPLSGFHFDGEAGTAKITDLIARGVDIGGKLQSDGFKTLDIVPGINVPAYNVPSTIYKHSEMTELVLDQDELQVKSGTVEGFSFNKATRRDNKRILLASNGYRSVTLNIDDPYKLSTIEPPTVFERNFLVHLHIGKTEEGGTLSIAGLRLLTALRSGLNYSNETTHWYKLKANKEGAEVLSKTLQLASNQNVIAYEVRKIVASFKTSSDYMKVWSNRTFNGLVLTSGDSTFRIIPFQPNAYYLSASNPFNIGGTTQDTGSIKKYKSGTDLYNHFSTVPSGKDIACTGKINVNGTIHTVTRLRREANRMVFYAGQEVAVQKFKEGTSQGVYTDLAVTQQFVIGATTGGIETMSILPWANATYDIGEVARKFRSLYLSGELNAQTLSALGAISAGGNITASGNLVGANVNTGQGNFKVGQNLRTTDSPSFSSLTLSSVFPQIIVSGMGAGSILLDYDSATAVYPANTTYVKVLEITVRYSGTVTTIISGTLRASGDGHLRVYKNGSAVGTVRRVSSATNGDLFSENISVLGGDKIQLYVARRASSTQADFNSVQLIIRGSKAAIVSQGGCNGGA